MFGKNIFWVWIALLAVVLAACAETPSSQKPENAKLNVFASATIIGDIARNVGGDAINLTVLLPAGTDPHSYQPTPQDIAKVSHADVVLLNGFGLEESLGNWIQNAATDATIVEVSAGIAPLSLTGDDGDGHSGTDPHTWTTAANGIIFTTNIETALAAAAPAQADIFHSNATAYRTSLEALDGWIQAQINTIPPEQRKLVMGHDAFGYFTQAYGLKQIGTVIPGFSTAAEPSARDLAQLHDTLVSLNAPAVFVGMTANVTVAERVTEDTGAKLVRLYTGALGEPGSGAETYEDYLRFNTNAIVSALR